MVSAGPAVAKTKAFNNVADKFVDVLSKGFSKPQEFEADQESVKYTAAAGYDPNGLTRFLQRIRAKQNAGGANLFATHPGLDDRITKVTNQISAAGTGGHGATLPDRFAQWTGKPKTTVGMAAAVE